MQERYSVNYYSPGINIVRNRDEYVDAGLQDYAHVHVVKETRLDGRYRWEADGNSFENFYSVMFSRSDWKVCSVITDHRACLLYTSPSPRDQRGSRMPSSA